MGTLKNVEVNLCTAAIKEDSLQWLTALYDGLRGRPELISYGLREAGIVVGTIRPGQDI